MHYEILQFVTAALREVHSWQFALGGAVMGTVHLVERRGRSKRELDPRRQIEIKTLIESMPEAVFIFGHDGQLIELNSGAEKMFEASRETIRQNLCRNLCEFLKEWGETSDGASAIIAQALKGETLKQERRELHISELGRSLEVLVSARPIREGDGTVVGVLVIVRDETELMMLQRKMGDAERHTAIGKMTASLAHDFNNVLDTISQAVSVMEVDPNRPTDERQLIMRMIRNAVKRGAEMVSGMRKYLVGGATGADLVDLNEVLEESIELTRPLWQASRNISVERRFQPVQKICANANELRRVFTNLVINSIEAMPGGGTLTVSCEQTGNTIKGSVEDTGEGIPEDKKRHIFSPYFSTKEGGTGLGLSSAESAVRAQRGRIMFDSREGQGTRFWVEFPTASTGAVEKERKIA